MKSIMKSIVYTGLLTVISCLALIANSQAAEVDFSCMEESVRGKPLVTDRYKEYDVNIQNTCPGSAYWSMCIERLDPWTYKVLETHTPSGLVEEGKKARVNLHMKRGPEWMQFRNRFQPFYVNIAYGIKTPAKASCRAAMCEQKKSSLRAEILANEKAWLNANKSLEKKIASECPGTGWETEEQSKCEAGVRKASQAEMVQFVRKDVVLREQVANVDPVQCQVYAGGLLTE
ncbi:MAG: hypothetical protein GWP58_05560 [Gammaproteobacteria bacterium]|nr:hypothetical protein [Gammaproteobacteria bacterium]